MEDEEERRVVAHADVLGRHRRARLRLRLGDAGGAADHLGRRAGVAPPGDVARRDEPAVHVDVHVLDALEEGGVVVAEQLVLVEDARDRDAVRLEAALLVVGVDVALALGEDVARAHAEGLRDPPHRDGRASGAQLAQLRVERVRRPRRVGRRRVPVGQALEAARDQARLGEAQQRPVPLHQPDRALVRVVRPPRALVRVVHHHRGVHPVHQAALGDEVVDARVDLAKGCLRATESKRQGR